MAQTILEIYEKAKISKQLPTDKNKDKTPIDDDLLKEPILEKSRKGKKNVSTKYSDVTARV